MTNFNSYIGNALKIFSLAAFLVVGGLAMHVSLAHAQDCCDDGGDYGYSVDTPDYGYSVDTPDYGYSVDTPDYGYSVDTPSSYDYGNSSYGGYSSGGGYSYPTYSSPTYSSGSYSSPSYSYPTYSAPAYSAPSNVVNSGNTSVFAPTTITDNGNSCTATNSCNTTYNGGNTTVTTNNSTPIINNVVTGGGSSYPVYTPVYTPTYYPTYTPTYTPVYTPQQTIAYNNPAPYVTLAAVPYTGLDLGPFGEVIYWSLLVLFALAGAYLIAIKRVQNRAAAWLKTFLFGEKEEITIAAATTESASQKSSGRPAGFQTFAQQYPSAQVNTQTRGIDEFIMGQIHRTA